MTTPEICGEAAPEYSGVKDAFARALAEREVGASVALYVEGEPAVHLWGGFCDRRRTVPWQEDTMACTFSVSKGITAIALLTLIDESALDIDLPVVHYWPEFAGSKSSPIKQRVTVRQLMSHQAGLPGFRETMPTGVYYDWSAIVAALEEEAPWWSPGSRHGYHARTHGFLLGELFRRITGSHIGEWMRMRWPELDFYIGLQSHQYSRCAQMLPARMRIGDTDTGNNALLAAMRKPHSATWAAFSNPTLGSGYMNKPEFRGSHMPAVSGHGTAVALAGLYGRIDDYLSSAVLAEACRPHSSGRDEVLLTDTCFGLGFMLPGGSEPFGVGETSFGHAGAGGSIAFGDLERRLGFAFVMNQMEGGVISGGRSVAELVRYVVRID